MILFNPYTPQPIEQEYADVLQQERTERIDAARPDDPYEIFGDIIESLLPDQCPVTYVEEDGHKCLCSQFELLDYQSDLLYQAKDLMPEQHSHLLSYLDGPLSLETDERVDEILDNVFIRKYGLEW